VARAPKNRRIASHPSLPALSPSLERLRAFYRMETLPDGYPGRREEESSITAHPIYGTYVLFDYVKQYARNPTTDLRDAIRVVARAAIDRMEPVEGGLAFYYETDAHAISRQPERHYSGLTQAYYAVALYRAFLATGDPGLETAARACYRSLLVPARRGGVLYRWRGGVGIAEVPTTPRDLILNGWLSILHSVGEYARLSRDRGAQSMLNLSARTMARLLPLYDVPELANSRYSLTGPVYLRVKFGSRIAGVTLRRCRTVIPTEGDLGFDLRPTGTRWQNYLTHPDEDVEDNVGGSVRLRRSALRLNAVLSLVSHPDENKIAFTIETPRPMPLTLLAYVGTYDPLTSAPVDRRWVEMDSVSVEAGRHAVRMKLPWKDVHLVAYPTNFIKRIDGQPTNVYHMIHIKRLRELHEMTGMEELGAWADRWEDYVLRWSRMPRYRGLHVRNYFTDIASSSIDLATHGRRARRRRAGVR
jgi:hypothetical protein